MGTRATVFLTFATTNVARFHSLFLPCSSFFDMLKQKFKKNLCFIVAKRDGEIIAGTFNVVKAGRFYGRYWGTFDDEVST